MFGAVLRWIEDQDGSDCAKSGKRGESDSRRPAMPAESSRSLAAWMWILAFRASLGWMSCLIDERIATAWWKDLLVEHRRALGSFGVCKQEVVLAQHVDAQAGGSREASPVGARAPRM